MLWLISRFLFIRVYYGNNNSDPLFTLWYIVWLLKRYTFSVRANLINLTNFSQTHSMFGLIENFCWFFYSWESEQLRQGSDNLWIFSSIGSKIYKHSVCVSIKHSKKTILHTATQTENHITMHSRKLSRCAWLHNSHLKNTTISLHQKFWNHNDAIAFCLTFERPSECAK